VNGSATPRVVRTARWVHRRYEAAAGGIESGIQVLERLHASRAISSGPFEGWEFLWQPAVLVSSRCACCSRADPFPIRP